MKTNDIVYIKPSLICNWTPEDTKGTGRLNVATIVQFLAGDMVLLAFEGHDRRFQYPKSQLEVLHGLPAQYSLTS